MPVYLESPLGYFICRKSLPEFKSLENQFLTSWVTAGTLTSWVAAGTLTSWVTAGTPLNQTQKDHNKWAKAQVHVLRIPIPRYFSNTTQTTSNVPVFGACF